MERVRWAVGGVPSAHHHRGARLGQPIGDGRTDALRAAGDESHLAVEVDADGHRRKVYQT